jgi:hypothetical protein
MEAMGFFLGNFLQLLEGEADGLESLLVLVTISPAITMNAVVAIAKIMEKTKMQKEEK